MPEPFSVTIRLVPASFVERAQLSALILCKIASGEIDALKLKALRLETI